MAKEKGPLNSATPSLVSFRTQALDIVNISCVYSVDKFVVDKFKVDKITNLRRRAEELNPIP